MEVVEILRRFGVEPIKVRECAPGFSGARVWQVNSAAAEFALKRYPLTWPDRSRLTDIHALLRHAVDAGSPVPRPAGIQFVDGLVWDLVTWLPGRPLLADEPTSERCFAAGAVLARLHEVWGRKPALAPASVFERRMLALQEFNFANIDPGALPDLWRSVAAVVAQQVPRFMPQLDMWCQQPLPLHPCLADCWHDHVLFAGDDVTGLIDYAAVRVDYPLIDVARLLGSIDLTKAQELRVLDGYESVRPLTAVDWRLLVFLQQAGVIASLAAWVVRFARKDFDSADTERIERRVRDFLQRAERM